VRPPILSVEDLSPICDISKDHQFVILRSYFDGGNQPDSTQYKVLSLASVSGTKDQWLAFEGDWKVMLKKHGAPWLHTTDAVSLKNDPFTKENGWNKTKRDAFLSDCVRVVEKHLLQPMQIKPPGKHGLMPHVVTVVLADFMRAIQDNPEVPKDVTEICVTQSVGSVMERGQASFGAHFFHLIFDQNEPFKKHVVHRQENKKARKHLTQIVNRITSITEADMREVPALQMADLFAWSYSHKMQEPHHSWQERLLLHRSWVDDWYEYDALVQIRPGIADLVKSWNIPRGRRTR
jgi:hypothetical protein